MCYHQSSCQMRYIRDRDRSRIGVFSTSSVLRRFQDALARRFRAYADLHSQRIVSGPLKITAPQRALIWILLFWWMAFAPCPASHATIPRPTGASNAMRTGGRTTTRKYNGEHQRERGCAASVQYIFPINRSTRSILRCGPGAGMEIAWSLVAEARTLSEAFCRQGRLNGV